MRIKGNLFIWEEVTCSAREGMWEADNTNESMWWLNVSTKLSKELMICPVCEETLPYTIHSGGGGYNERLGRHYVERRKKKCQLCGWGYLHEDVDDWAGYEHFTLSILKEFHLNSTELPMNALGSHLRNNISDLFALDHRRFEFLVEDVFKLHGYSTILTQATKDGGVDIIVVQEDKSNIISIIECKKYSRNRKVGISAVRMLIGAAVSWGVSKGYLVTTSDFSIPAKQSILDFNKVGYQIDLVALSDLVQLLGVYNEQLPPLHRITNRMRQEIRHNSSS